MKKAVSLVLVCIMLLSFSSITFAAKEFPSKTIEITVPYAAGGSIDLCARIMAKYLEPALGVKVIVQNREGGGGATGTTYVAKAKPDGYTMLCNVPTHMYQSKTAEGVTYNRSSFRSVAQVADDPICISTLSTSKYTTLDELLAAAKENPDTITIAITSNWGAYDIGRLMLETAAGVKFRRVSYDGGANGLKALLSGEVDCLLSFPGEVLSYKASGDVNILAVALNERNDALSDVPTFKEQGYEVAFGNLRFFSVPAETPDEIVEVLEKGMAEVFVNPDFQAEMNASGFPVLVYTAGPVFDEYLVKLEEQLMPLVDQMLVQKAEALK